MNILFFILIALSFGVAAYHQIVDPLAAGMPSAMDALSKAMLDSAAGAVTLTLGLVGSMTLFLGLMKVAEAGGLLAVIARLLRPALIRLFPDVPANHPAMGAMIMNISANVLGLGNAATPFGIRAMQELDRLNPVKGTASNAMVLFLAINTSSVTLLPTGVVALRAAAGSQDPAGIVATTLVATTLSTLTAVITAKLLARFFPLGPAPVELPTASAPEEAQPEPSEPLPATETGAYPGWVSALALLAFFSIIPLTILWGKAIAPWIIPGLAMLLLGYGAVRRVRVYEVFVDGARDGFQLAIRIIPYLVAILVAVAMFRASGAMEVILTPLGALTAPFGLPAEALSMALLRPLSGSGAYAVLASIINDPAIGPDSYVGYLVSTIQGSTETTFYVLAVYFGAVGIRRMRHAVWTGIIADIAGVAGAVMICSLLYG
ncbi:nucleoside recognition domain-containing protein [Insolitispirillum peregrinum]|uniref:nucleoside recognition domain-containing protein n=1 Tax=Insolitispirillum peregrinum TaxID=80876 RepID=UPI003605B247